VGLIARLFGSQREEHDLGPLWRRVVEIAREPQWYAKGGIADSMAGRFDALSTVLALVLIRMEGNPALRAPAARLTECFVADMDGQLRQEGVGDLVVGKRMSKLVGALGGRLDAYREGLASADPAVLEAAVARNVTLTEGTGPEAVAAEMRCLAGSLAALSDAALLAARIER